MATFNGKVTGGGLNLRTSPSTGASSPIQIPNNTAISVSTISDNEEWFSTSYGGYSGYVVAQYVAITADGGTCTVTTTSDSLNIRKSANTSATIVYKAAKGSTLRLLDTTSVTGWYRVSNASGTGWGSVTYLTVGSNPGDGTGGTGGTTGDSDYAIRATVDTVKHGVGGTLNMRASASSGSSVVTTISNGATIYVKSMSGEWLAAKYNSYTGYVMAKFVVGTDAYNGSTGGNTGSGSSDDFSDNVTTNPIVNTHYTFRPSAAVDYAKAHSSNTNKDSNGNYVADPKRNKSFGEGATNACANFVHQCLLAGGARMFDGWCYKLTGIPSTWDSESWTLTNKGRRRLLEKKWIERIPVTSVKAGDIIYTYYSDYENREKMKTPFNHVTIAISDYSSSDGGCYVCGHTTNQNNKFKKLSDTGIPCAYCYRVKSSLGGDGTEKAIDLTDGNSKAI